MSHWLLSALHRGGGLSPPLRPSSPPNKYPAWVCWLLQQWPMMVWQMVHLPSQDTGMLVVSAWYQASRTTYWIRRPCLSTSMKDDSSAGHVKRRCGIPFIKNPVSCINTGQGWHHFLVSIYVYLMIFLVHNRGIVSVYFNHFSCIEICNTLERHLSILSYINLNVDECSLISPFFS